MRYVEEQISANFSLEFGGEHPQTMGPNGYMVIGICTSAPCFLGPLLFPGQVRLFGLNVRSEPWLIWDISLVGRAKYAVLGTILD